MMTVAGLVISVLLRLLNLTLRPRHVGAEKLGAIPQYIFSFWHAHMMLMLHSRFRRPITVMSSKSKDGDIAVRIYRNYGVDAVRGSSTRGGSEALRQIVKRARAGSNMAFTPDGPKGPPRMVKEGVVAAAQLSGLPIIPVAFASEKHILLRSWDRMIVPKPFTRTLFVYGDPIHVPRGGDIEEWRKRVEDAMNANADFAEQHFKELWENKSSRA
jgi:lysophospholipid acyltransferase (LPLAT)-like uncharacterized protein